MYILLLFSLYIANFVFSVVLKFFGVTVNSSFNSFTKFSFVFFSIPYPYIDIILFIVHLYIYHILLYIKFIFFIWFYIENNINDTEFT